MTLKEMNPGLASADGVVNETWRDLARRIEKETDPATIMELARQLIASLDEEGYSSKRKA